MKVKSKQYKRWNAWALARIFSFILFIPAFLLLRSNLLIVISVSLIWAIVFIFTSFKQELAWNILMNSVIEDTQEY